MRVLFLTTKYSTCIQSPYLTNDLCTAMSRRGDSVTVVNIDWGNENGGSFEKSDGGVLLCNVPRLELTWLPKALRLPAVWFMSSAVAYWRSRRLLKSQNFDLCIVVTPLTVFTIFIYIASRFLKCRWIALCWDFFPIHQVKLGLIPRGIAPLLHIFENGHYVRCSRICVLSEDYKKFLYKNYKISPSTEVVVSGLWGGYLPEASLGASVTLSREVDLSKAIVFGGQLTAGRGLENFVMLSRVAHELNPNLRILVITRSDEFSNLAVLLREIGRDNIIFMKQMSRADYVEVIRKCMAGLISLDSSTGCPSFPSKLVDYTRAGIPIIAIDSLNPSLAKFLRGNGIGFYFQSDEEEVLALELARLDQDDLLQRSLREKSEICFREKFDVDRALEIIAPME